MTIAIIIIVIVAALLVLWVIAIFNKLVSLRSRVDNAFAQIEVQLKRRYDLIPNLVETAKAYMAHERDTLEAVIAARNAAADMLSKAAASPHSPAAIKGLIGAEGKLAGALSGLNVVMEAYPTLKADRNMMQLTEELTSTENKVSFARQALNDQVMAYNTYRQSFPPLLFATAFGHPQDAMFLEFEDSEAFQDAPKVSF
jgi:LemA protein